MQYLSASNQRPLMPTELDDERVAHQAARLQVLLESHEQLVREYIVDKADEDFAQVVGEPDTSSNPLADIARQLSTPGLYGKRPEVLHRDADAVEGLVGVDGLMEHAGYFTRGPWVQYLTLGLGDMLARWHVVEGRLAMRLVYPDAVYMAANQADPSTPVELWELCTREVREFGSIYVWDVYKLGDVPSYRVHAATGKRGREALGDDLSNLVLPGGALEGDDYPWRGEDGRAELPWSRWQSADTGTLWNWRNKRGAHRGTLNAAVYATYAGHCALHATGSHVMVAGLTGGLSHVRSSDARAGATPTAMLTPGALSFYEIDGVAQPFVHEVGPGVNLASVEAFHANYEMRQAVRWGLNPSDLSRTSSNPASAAALMVSNRGKREFSDQVTPVFGRQDSRSCRVAAIVARAGGLGRYAESGYVWKYHRIPHTAQEEQATRDRLDWEVARGMRSRISVYRETNPGVTREAAVAALVRVQRDEAELEAAIAAAGLNTADTVGTDTRDTTDASMPAL